MQRELLILSLLGIENKFISFIYLNLTEDEANSLFMGHVLDIQFKHNIFDDKTVNILLDNKKISTAINKAEKILKYSIEKGIHIISIFDEDYPSLLKRIHNPPLFLYGLGNINLLNSGRSIACVGTRNPSKLAINSVSTLVSSLSLSNFVIISGLAYGIDYEAHKVCLDNNGKTIAVLAHGLDRIYPKEHQHLSTTIIEQGGLLLSEYPVFTDIKKEHFVQRNRIVSGISDGVIVVEADEKSGTMHTARFAYKQEKPIFCPSDNLSTGVQKLIRTQNAYSVKSYKEILNHFSIRIPPDEDTTYRIYDILSQANLHIHPQETGNKVIYKKCTTKIDSIVYGRIQDLANENNLTIKELINAVLQGFVDTYEAGENKK